MDKKRPFLIVGLGSIGRRHLKNLSTLGFTNLMAVTNNICQLPKQDLPSFKAFSSLKDALKEKPIAVFICNPTALHLESSILSAQHDCHLFIEKPIAHSLRNLNTLEKEIVSRGLICSIGFQYRYHATLKKLKELLDMKYIGDILEVNVHWGEYLPSWHPWEDYSQSYSARKDLGGGVSLTLSHPFDYLRWLLGSEVQSILAQERKQSALNIEVEDTSTSLLTFWKGTKAIVTLNYFERPSTHMVTFIGTQGKFEWNGISGQLNIERSSFSSKVITLSSKWNRNTMYIEELKNFITSIELGVQPSCSFKDGFEVQRIISALKKSARTGQLVQIDREDRLSIVS